MRNTLRLASFLVVSALISCSGSCGKGDRFGAPGEPEARKLEPLPAAPKLDVAQDQLASGPLTVVAALPTGETRGEVRPTITFSKPVKTLEAIEEGKDTPFPGKLTPNVPGEWRWLGSASVEFVPQGTLPYATEFQVVVPKGVRAIDGSTLEADYSYAFSTPRLELQETVPMPGYRWLTPEGKVTLTFNQPVANDEVARGVHFQVGGKLVDVKVLSRVSVAEERRKQAQAANPSTPLPPPDPAKVGYENLQTRYEVIAAQKLPLGSEVSLIAGEAMRGEQGPLALGKRVEHSFRTYGPAQIVAVHACRADADRCPYGPLALYPSNGLDPKSVREHLKVTPAVELDWDRAESWTPRANGYYGDERPVVYIPGRFKPGTAYQVEVTAGVADDFGQKTREAFAGMFHTSDLEPELRDGGRFALLEATAGTSFPFPVVNLSRVDLKLWKLTPEEAAQISARPVYEDKPLLTRAPDLERTDPLSFPRNEVRVQKLDLAPLFGGAKTGLALLSLSAPDERYRPDAGHQVIAQITDLVPHLKASPTKGAVWVTRLSTSAPVAGAAVALYDRTGKQRWTGTTDKDGLAELPGLASLGLGYAHGEAPYAFVTATLDGDTGVSSSDWNSGIEPYEFSLSQGWEDTRPDSSGALFTDRGIYRPGDRAYVKGIVRYWQLGQLKTPAEGSRFALTVTDPRGKEVTKAEVETNRFGTFSYELALPAGGATGFYSIGVEGKTKAGSVRLGGSLRVEEYRAPQFEVKATASAPSLVAGEALEGSATARYLFGAPMGNAKVRWSVTRDTTWFAPDDAQGFQFGEETWWYDDSAPRTQSGFVSSGEGTLDASGTFRFKAGTVETPGGATYRYTVEAEVEDVNRQRVAGSTSVTVHPAAVYVGIRGPSGFGEAGKEQRLEAVVVDPAGKRVSGKKVELTILSRRWKSIRKKDASGGFITVSEPSEDKVAGCSLESSAQGLECKYTPKEAGLYIVRAEVKDDQGRKQSSSLGLYVTGPGFVSWQRNDTDRIELVADKARYSVGDVAKVLVKSPYTEVRGLLTVERDGVMEKRPLSLKGSVTTLEIPITEAMVPNVYASVLLVHGRSEAKAGIEPGLDPGRPAIRVGMIKLPVETKTRRLQVQVKPARSTYRPAEEVQVAIDVKDAAGKGARSEVTLYAVDEAVLSLTAYQTPDPLAAIYPERPLSVRMGEPQLHLVRARAYGEKGESQGGGGGSGEGAGFRSNFQTTAFFSPTVETDAQGKATVKFKLPDNLTAFRVMAVVVGETQSFGSADARIEVNKPLLLQGALPRLARVGDAFEAGVVVHANQSVSAKVTVTAEGLSLDGDSSRTVQVAPTSPQEVRFRFKAEQAGDAKLKFAVEGNGERDGLQLTLPVQLPIGFEAVATSGDTTTERLEGVSAPKDAWPDQGGFEVQLASTALGRFDQGFSQLIDYPYGCLEQQSSRLVPFVALREIAGQFQIPWADASRGFFGAPEGKAKDPDKVIASTIGEISKLQDEDGAFRYWPDSQCATAWPSAYATWALGRAKQVGFEVDPEVLSKGTAFLARVAGGKCRPCENRNGTCDLETRVFASFVLARLGQPKPSFYGEYLNRRKELSLFGQVLLTDALFIGKGDRAQAKTVLAEVLNHAKQSPRGVHLEEVDSGTYAALWQSDVRTTGALLSTLTDVSPDHPFVAQLANYLTGVRREDGTWRSTQEAAFALTGLAEVVRTKEAQTPNFKATVALGGSPLFTEQFSGRSLEVKEKTVSIAELAKKASGKQPLSFKKEGDGVLYYSAVLRYAPKQLSKDPVERGMYVQRWFEPYSGGGQARSFAAGELVRVRVRVASNQERHWAVFEVPLPAGLEPVDTTLATTAKGPRARGEEEQEGYDYENAEDQPEGEYLDEGGDGESPYLGEWAYAFWSPFNHTERRDAKVVLFADHLPPGTHVTSFVARATTPGKYVLPPATGSLMYEPEVFGRSDAGELEVTVPSKVSGGGE